MIAPTLPSICKYCFSENLEIGSGRGPHAAELRCADCDRHLQWIGKSLAIALGIDGGEA